MFCRVLLSPVLFYNHLCDTCHRTHITCDNSVTPKTVLSANSGSTNPVPSVIIAIVVMRNVDSCWVPFILSVEFFTVMLTVVYTYTIYVMLSVVSLSFVMLNVILLSVMAPIRQYFIVECRLCFFIRWICQPGTIFTTLFFLRNLRKAQ